MIEHECSTRCIRQVFRAELLELLQRVPGARVVHHRKIHPRDDDVSCFDGAVSVRAENFLGQCMSQRLLRYLQTGVRAFARDSANLQTLYSTVVRRSLAVRPGDASSLTAR